MENSENSEDNKGSAAALRAAARRRKILENGNNRLGKITGRVHNEEMPKIETVQTNGIYDDPELERDFFEGPATRSMEALGGDQDVFELLKTLQQESSRNKTEEPTQQQTEHPQSPFLKFIKSQYPIVIIALLVYALFALHCERFIGGSVLSLFVAWECLVFILSAFIVNEPVKQHQIIAILCMFLGINAQSLQFLFKILGLFNKVFRDIATFLFTFVITHLLYSFFIVGESMSEILDKDFTKLLKQDEI